jgi:hypothetical protein
LSTALSGAGKKSVPSEESTPDGKKNSKPMGLSGL